MAAVLELLLREEEVAASAVVRWLKASPAEVTRRPSRSHSAGEEFAERRPQFAREVSRQGSEVASTASEEWVTARPRSPWPRRGLWTRKGREP